MLEKAYQTAREAHKDQVRKSGEPYIIHPLWVGIILADLEMDKETIAAGLLHQLEIAIDDFRIFEPLIGIVVAAVKNFRRVTDDRAVMIHRCILPSSPKKLFYPRPPAPGLSGSPPESVRH